MRCVALVLMVSCAVPAAELVIRDARLGIELLPVDFDYTLTDSTGSRTGSDAYASQYGVMVGGRYSLAQTGASHGVVVGLDVGAARASYEAASAIIGTYLVAGEGGYGWAMNDDITLVGTLRLGLGAATGRFHGSGVFDDFAPAGGYVEYGARAGVLWNVTERLVVDGTLGFRQSETRLSDRGRDLDLSQSGMTVSLGLSWRFTASPWRLE